MEVISAISRPGSLKPPIPALPHYSLLSGAWNGPDPKATFEDVMKMEKCSSAGMMKQQLDGRLFGPPFHLFIL